MIRRRRREVVVDEEQGEGELEELKRLWLARLSERKSGKVGGATRLHSLMICVGGVAVAW